MFAAIVLSIETSLLYLIGAPEVSVVVWKNLLDQFHKKTWSNKLSLTRKHFLLSSPDLKKFLTIMSTFFVDYNSLSIQFLRIKVHNFSNIP